MPNGDSPYEDKMLLIILLIFMIAGAIIALETKNLLSAVILLVQLVQE